MNSEFPSSTDFLAFTALALLAVSALVLAEWARSEDWLGLPSSRRFVHVTVGLFVAVATIALRSPIWLFGSAVVALIVTSVSRRRGWLRSIHGPGNESVGTITFPLALVMILPFFWNSAMSERHPLALGFAVLAVSDPVAAIVGTRFKNRRVLGWGPNGKTFAGSAAFGITAWIISGFWLSLIDSISRLPIHEMWLWHLAAMIAITAAAAEMVGRRGWDNLLIVAFVVLVVLGANSDERARFLGWCVVLSLAFSVLAYRLRFLSADGATMAGLLGGLILFFGGWTWIVPPTIFFLFSSLLSTWSNRRRGPSGLRQHRGHRRDAVQVLANGVVGCALVTWNFFEPSSHAYWLFTAAFAAAAADTFATEVGMALRGVTWSVVSGSRVESGTSGGVSILGFIACIVGAFVVALSAALATGTRKLGPIAIVTMAGFLAAVVDSLLGATIQARFRESTGRTTEAAVTDGERNQRVAGLHFVNNDTVNLLCTAAGVWIAWLLLVVGN